MHPQDTHRRREPSFTCVSQQACSPSHTQIYSKWMKINKCNTISKTLPIKSQVSKINTCHHSLEYANKKSTSMNCGWIQRGPAESWVSKDNNAGARYLLCIQLLEFSTSVWKHGPGNSPQGSRPKHSRLAGEHAVLREGTKVRLRKKPEKPEDSTVLATGFMYGACAGAVHAPPTSGRGAHLQARPLCSCKPSQLPDSLALYPVPIFSMYSLTNKPFKQTILCRNHCFSGPALHSREEPRIPCRSLDSDVSQTEGWIFPEVTE